MKKIRLSEQFTVGDLLNNAVSDITAKYLFDREHGTGSNVIKLFAVQIRNDKLYIHYRSYPTYVDNEDFRVTSNGQSVRTEWYDTLFQFDKAAENLGTFEEFQQFNTAEKAATVSEFLSKGMCRVWCNCPAFYNQGHWEAMDKIDSTIFTFPGPKGTGEWEARHAPGLATPGITICKHIAACIPKMNKRDISSITTEITKISY